MLPTLQGDVVGRSGDGLAYEYGDSLNPPAMISGVTPSATMFIDKR